MRGRELLQRTPVRLAAFFSVLFILTFLALFAVLYVGINARLESDMHRRIEETFAAVAAFDDPNDLSDIVSVVRKEADSVRQSDFVFALIDDTGAHLAGNVSAAPSFAGWRWIDRGEITFAVERKSASDVFLAQWRPLSHGKLLVGLGNREVRQMGSYLISVLGYGVVGTGIIISILSVMLAAAAQRRIYVFAKTLAAVSRGQISARVPLSGSGDDIDQLAAQVNRTLGQLQTLIENVNQSSSDIAHDLKRPVARIRHKLEEASLIATKPEGMRAAMQEAIDDLDSITRTFEALLNITQREAGARKSRFQLVDLGGIMDDVYEIYAPVAEDAGHRLMPTSTETKPFRIFGDAELLTQLLANLIENSLCHTPEGTTIALGLAHRDGSVIMLVADDGPGIPTEERENVFRRLYRLERARSAPGSGLGLSLAHAIAELHDARISLDDNSPGLTVSVAFRLALES